MTEEATTPPWKKDLPRKPSSAYLLFATEYRRREGGKITVQEAAEKWKALDEATKQVPPHLFSFGLIDKISITTLLLLKIVYVTYGSLLDFMRRYRFYL